MITLKLNLLNLKCSVVKMKATSGMLDCLVIPIEKNNLFRGEKGIYLDLIAFEIKNPKDGSRDTHLIKQSFSKEEREKMGEAELSVLPILGNLSVSQSYGSAEPVSSPDPQPESDDLPF